MQIGLRIDVDTFRGTKYGMPNLCKLLASRSITASFFCSVGPDNMGRHLRRLIRPSFLFKMLRTGASRLYGWDILLKGPFRTGPVIGERLATVIGAASDAGHEIGLHAWDHHAWQVHIDAMDSGAIYRSLKRGVELLTSILGRPPVCSAVPGWKCNDLTLMQKTKFPFTYNSDCRGECVFRPLVGGEELSQPQIPVTLPTYDEVIGRNGISCSNYNDYIISLIKPDKLNILTIHAEVEGIVHTALFDTFLERAQSKGVFFVPLGTFVTRSPLVGSAAIVSRIIPGREGWVSCQGSESCTSKGPES